MTSVNRPKFTPVTVRQNKIGLNICHPATVEFVISREFAPAHKERREFAGWTDGKATPRYRTKIHPKAPMVARWTRMWAVNFAA